MASVPAHINHKAIGMAPFIFSACADEAANDVRPQQVGPMEVLVTDDEDGDDSGDQ